MNKGFSVINSMKPGGGQGHDAKRGEVLERIQQQYGKPEEKQREAVKKLGKDEFFKIMVTQIQHQDPLKPYQNEQMAAQMAQFTSLEQMVNMNQNLDKLTQSQQPLHNLGAANLIGKYVTADSSRILHKEGKSSTLAFELPNDATQVRINILNERGETVQEIEKKNLKKGENKLEWDGKKSNNMAANTGTYIMQISAIDDKGRSMPVATSKTELVRGVAFEGRETVLLVGEVSKPQKLLLSNVSKIVDTSEGLGKKPGALASPGGMEIEGLEEFMQAQNAKAEAPPPPPPEEPMMIDPASMDAKKYMQVDPSTMRKGQEKPVALPKLSNEEIRDIIANGPDLGANPAAQAMRAGEPLPESGSNIAAGQSVQSSEAGSTAGKWAE